MQGIYQIRNIIDDKRYIGSTNDFDRRWIEHKAVLQVNDGNTNLQRAWNKYGKKNFVFEIIEEVQGNSRILLGCEQCYLDEGFRLGILYNLAKMAGGGNFGEEVNRKRSATMTGRRLTTEHCQNTRIGVLKYYETHDHCLKGQKRGPQSMEHKEAIKAGLNRFYATHDSVLKGTQQTKEHRRNKREANLRYYESHDGYWLGKRHSEETCNKISKALQGRKITWGDKISKALEGNENGIGNRSAAKPYPAFYNVKTGEFIPPGNNLAKMCRDHDLSYMNFWDLKRRKAKRTRDGWKVA